MLYGGFGRIRKRVGDDAAYVGINEDTSNAAQP